MSSFGSLKEGHLTKQGGEHKNWKKRWFILQDNIMYYFADQKDEMSKGTIPLGKVTKIQIQEHKKKFIFEMHTNIEGRIFYIQADTEALLKDWVDAITSAWVLHTMKDKYKDRFFHGADNYRHTLFQVGKRILTLTVRTTGVTKAVITGGGRAHKARPAEAATIMTDNAELGAVVLELAKSIIETDKDAYKAETRKKMEAAASRAIRAAELIAGRGAGSVNEASLQTTSKQLVTEIHNLINQTYLPSQKTNMLHLIQLHAQIIGKFSEASNTDMKISESKRLEVLGNAFPVIAKEVFPHIPDLTYAQPLIDNAAMVPIVTGHVRELVKTAAFYSQGETYATNSVKTLFYLLNDMRRATMAGFPPSPIDEKFPQVGPPDAQFQLSSDEYQNSMNAVRAGPQNIGSTDPSQLANVSFEEFIIAPAGPAEDSPQSSLVGSWGSDDRPGGGYPGGPGSMPMPMRSVISNQMNRGNTGMTVGSAPHSSQFAAAMNNNNNYGNQNFGGVPNSLPNNGGYPGPGSAKFANSAAKNPVPAPLSYGHTPNNTINVTAISNNNQISSSGGYPMPQTVPRPGPPTTVPPPPVGAPNGMMGSPNSGNTISVNSVPPKQPIPGMVALPGMGSFKQPSGMPATAAPVGMPPSAVPVASPGMGKQTGGIPVNAPPKQPSPPVGVSYPKMPATAMPISPGGMTKTPPPVVVTPPPGQNKFGQMGPHSNSGSPGLPPKGPPTAPPTTPPGGYLNNNVNNHNTGSAGGYPSNNTNNSYNPNTGGMMKQPLPGVPKTAVPVVAGGMMKQPPPPQQPPTAGPGSGVIPKQPPGNGMPPKGPPTGPVGYTNTNNNMNNINNNYNANAGGMVKQGGYVKQPPAQQPNQQQLMIQQQLYEQQMQIQQQQLMIDQQKQQQLMMEQQQQLIAQQQQLQQQQHEEAERSRQNQILDELSNLEWKF